MVYPPRSVVPKRLPVWIEAPLLIATTALGCWLFFDLGRQVPLLRVWIGLPSKMPQAAANVSPVAIGEAR